MAELNSYPSEELQTLQAAIALAKTVAAKDDAAFVFNQLDKWNDRIKEAITDSSFEEQYRDAHSLKTSREARQNNVVVLVEPLTF